MNDWLVVGVLGVLFLIFIHFGRRQSQDFHFELRDQIISVSQSHRN